MAVEPGTESKIIPPALFRLGAIGWATVGVVLGVLALFVSYRWLSGLIVPVTAALVLAVMTLPLTNWLDRHMARGLAVFLVVLMCAALIVGLSPDLHPRGFRAGTVHRGFAASCRCPHPGCPRRDFR